MQDDSPDATNWLKVVAILQEVFQDGTLAEECTCEIVVLIPKRKGGFWGIGFIEVLWKAIASLLNCRLTAVISFHDTLHGFWVGRGTGTAALKANLLRGTQASPEPLGRPFRNSIRTPSPVADCCDAGRLA